MAVKQYVRRALMLPPHVLVRKALSKVQQGLAALYQYQRDCWLSTYGALPGPADAAFGHCFPHLSADSLLPGADRIAVLTAHCLAHRFDLLGSGWVQVRHGMGCRGLEGHRYVMGAPVQVDAGGRWLCGEVNRANLRESRRIWSLVDKDYVPIDWHLDFKSGYRWRADTWFRQIRYAHMPGVDVKVPWELARMQHLPQLAWAYALASAGQPGFAAPAEYAREFRNQILDFIATNPPRFGVNWHCTMDAGIRVANWLVAYDLLRGYGAGFDAAFERELLRSVYQHGRQIVGHLEWDPGLRSNHYLANIVGLLFVAAYLPRSAEIDAWLAFAVQELVAEVDGQFTPDGANFEASTCYHRLSAEMVVYATALLLDLPDGKGAALRQYDHRRHRVKPSLRPGPLPLFPLAAGGPDAPAQGGRQSPFPPWYFELLERMAEFTFHITKPDGRVPQIGDNDSGRFLKLQPVYERLTVAAARARYANLDGYDALPDDAAYYDEDCLDHRHLVAAVNGLFGRDDLAAGAGAHCREAELVRGLAGGVRLPSYLGPGEPPAAARVRIGGGADWQRLCDRLAALPAGQRRATSIPAPGGNLREGLRLLAYPAFGLYLYRSARLYLAIRCGPVGQNGNGGHAHNDQLAIELTVDGVDWIADPGTFLYTPLPRRRNEYRSARAHFVPRLAGREPGGLDLGLFRLGDCAQAECLYFGPEGFVGLHRGYGEPVYRLVAVEDQAVRIEDGLGGAAPAEWADDSSPPFSPKYGSRWR